MNKERLAIIIATKDRPQEITRLLKNISEQEVGPVQVIVVDGGREPVEERINKFRPLPVDYIRKIPASLTIQRNTAIRHLRDEATIVAFLDDDIIFERGSLKNMMKFWEEAQEDTGGASFNNMSDRYNKPGLLQKLFFVNADMPGRILKSGFQSKICSLDKTIQVEWLVGCAMTYRKKVFNEFMFDEWFSGYARYEDVDFSYRVGKKYKLFVVADAKVRHLNTLEDVTFSFTLGRMEVINRLYFTGKHKDLSVILCYWALFGLFTNNMVKGILFMNRRYINRARGNLKGFFDSLCPVCGNRK